MEFQFWIWKSFYNSSTPNNSSIHLKLVINAADDFWITLLPKKNIAQFEQYFLWQLFFQYFKYETIAMS